MMRAQHVVRIEMPKNQLLLFLFGGVLAILSALAGRMMVNTDWKTLFETWFG